MTKLNKRADLFVELADDPREFPRQGGELDTLMDFLRFQRTTLELKCAGLSAADLARRSVEPSTLSLLGLVRHMADVERVWFRRRLDGQEAPSYFCTPDDPDGDFDGAVGEPEVVERAWELWRAEVAFADDFVARAPHLDIRAELGGGVQLSLREVLVHMVEEYARHNGHADLLRERIDGRLGQ
ncbi:DinB family protein [Streptomyces sp. AJS327]|uniref:DinB family protein n=1 Tax=Streptomyces sp. AJS327 TaxID=2545265 RepID=UPI0015DE2C48|nr:DinB family protein [Streptomyces sp. AJS327]MBA0049936.1 DinB family protein [Streptomyces sp. AJS327]